MEKVKVDKKIYEALEIAKELGKGFNEIIKDLTIGKGYASEKLSALNKVDYINLAEIFVKGYELELSPEEKVLEYYKDLSGEYDFDVNLKLKYELKGIERTLYLLGIKIEGINK